MVEIKTKHVEIEHEQEKIKRKLQQEADLLRGSSRKADKAHDEKLMSAHFSAIGNDPELLKQYLLTMKLKGYRSSLEYFRKEIGGLRYFDVPAEK